MTEDRTRADLQDEGHALPAEADLIELALARGSADSGPDSGSGAAVDGELDPLDAARRAEFLELRAFLDGCRAALRDEPPADAGERSSALVERVLAATTREDLSWRGDLRLVGGFVVQRLRSSRMLRIAAAVLALHFVGLSVLAYHLLRQPNEPFINVDFERRPRVPFPEELAEPAGALPLPEAGEEPRVREVRPRTEDAGEGATDEGGPRRR